MRTFLVGGGGRESALGMRLAESSELHVLAPYVNPSLSRFAEASGGRLVLGDICDPVGVVRAAKDCRADFALVSSDAPLAAGVVDGLLAAGVATMGATRAAARIEWDKAFSRKVVEVVAPEANPMHCHVTTRQELDVALGQLADRPVAVKPQGLTGGKGVKVMGHHLDDHGDARRYAAELIDRQDFPIIEERIDGIEFTIQAITDGERTFFPPATYDYPFRYDGDTGPGTGGMGAFSCPTKPLPFLMQEEYSQACAIMQKVIDYLRSNGTPFNGVLNGGFFVSDRGVTVIEFNARFGDPECMNIMSLLAGNWVDVLAAISTRSYDASMVRLRDEASVVVYLVAPSYPHGSAASCQFDIDLYAAQRLGALVYFSSSEARQGGYEVIGTSRAVAFAATDRELSVARDRVYHAIGKALHGPLECRLDIADEKYIDTLSARRRAWRKA